MQIPSIVISVCLYMHAQCTEEDSMHLQLMYGAAPSVKYSDPYPTSTEPMFYNHISRFLAWYAGLAVQVTIKQTRCVLLLSNLEFQSDCVVGNYIVL